MSPWTRRRLLCRGGLAASLALAGCSGGRERSGSPARSGTATPTTAPPEPTAGVPSTSEPTSSTPTTDEPETNTPLPPAEQRYHLGEWHLADPWKFTVADIELSTTFQTDDGETYEMPTDEHLLLVTTRIENVQTSRYHYTSTFDGLVDGRVYVDELGFPHPAFTYYVRTSDLAQVEYSRRWAPEALPIDPGEIATSWYAWAIPREVGREDVRIGYDPDNDGSYPIRWMS